MNEFLSLCRYLLVLHEVTSLYRMALIFHGSKFSRIAVLKEFVE